MASVSVLNAKENERYQIKTNAVVSTNCFFSPTMGLAKQTVVLLLPRLFLCENSSLSKNLNLTKIQTRVGLRT